MNIIHKFASVTIDRPLNELPNVHVLPQYIPQKTWPSSYKANNAFILPSLVKDGPTTCKGHGDGASCDCDVSEWHNSVHDQPNSYPLDIDGLVEVGILTMRYWLMCLVVHVDSGRRVSRTQVCEASS